jgi:hypothetical protein
MSKRTKQSTPGKSSGSAKPKAKRLLRIKLNACECFLSVGGNLCGAVAYAESIFKSQGPIQFLSGINQKDSNGTTYSILIPSESLPHIAEGT